METKAYRARESAILESHPEWMVLVGRQREVDVEDPGEGERKVYAGSSVPPSDSSSGFPLLVVEE